MDHQTALKSQAVERYTLNELTSSEKEKFEEHYFSCSDCADALREYGEFIANTRAVFIEDAAAAGDRRAAVVVDEPKTSWWKGVGTWFGAPVWGPALVALALIVVFRAEPVVESWQLQAVSRSGAVAEPHAVPKGTKTLAPSLELKGMDAKRWEAYHWELKDASGKVVETGVGHDTPLKLALPAFELTAQKMYVLTVRGDHDNESQKPLESSFAIEFK